MTTEILRNALSQARDARLSILGAMREAISAPREQVAAHAPRIISTKIHPDYIGMVIGKGGETIRSLEAEYEVQIDIEEDGTIRIYGTNARSASAPWPMSRRVGPRMKPASPTENGGKL